MISKELFVITGIKFSTVCIRTSLKANVPALQLL